MDLEKPMSFLSSQDKWPVGPVLSCSSSITSSPKSTESTSLGGEKTVMLSSCQNNLSSGSCEKVALMADSGKQKMLAHPAWATERTETNETQTFKGKMCDWPGVEVHP